MYKRQVVLTRIECEGVAGYGEASLPPYLGETQASVIQFLRKVDLSAFSRPENIDELLEYVDTIAPGNTAAKAAVDIALHDLDVYKRQDDSWVLRTTMVHRGCRA